MENFLRAVRTTAAAIASCNEEPFLFYSQQRKAKKEHGKLNINTDEDEATLVHERTKGDKKVIGRKLSDMLMQVRAVSRLHMMVSDVHIMEH